MIIFLHFSISFLLSTLLFLYILDPLEALLFSLIVGISSIIPDLDYILSKKFFKKIEHRSFTHSLIFPAILILFFRIQPFILLRIFGYLISFGILLHILEDMFTITGVKLLYPFSNKIFKIPIINTEKHKFVQYIASYLILLIVILIYLFI